MYISFILIHSHMLIQYISYKDIFLSILVFYFTCLLFNFERKSSKDIVFTPYLYRNVDKHKQPLYITIYYSNNIV